MTLGFGAKTDRESHNIYSQSAGGTNTYLGPGAYNSDRYGTIQPKKSGKAPFSSTATRNSNAEKKNSQAPGPGNYMIEQSLGSPNVPASSFHSTTRSVSTKIHLRIKQQKHQGQEHTRYPTPSGTRE
eukprot:CAMPEP_0194571526 /NCGR_PEP_ID=MMETSP0292-20121207/8475_1 /TAXON_ID=39354 /ORGANISM="Heterosigma akashiwo, Strain CCMP2393" /LENGTH=126 /DNA_ID=CAMNT_0039422331 /DNA_START=33 /DNA_END=410 /DNA_ORIENTATION=-